MPVHSVKYSAYPQCPMAKLKHELAVDCLYFAFLRDHLRGSPDRPICLNKLNTKGESCPGGPSRKKRGLGSPATLTDEF